uniref:(+)-piperitol/(+)-sesamin synthase n=1 Tax=Salvia miltiorrhiza TaxID=226208 RepID=A0A0B4VRY0_SALMI|nr:cytochrome P450 CYP81Q41 [Salvia miltiorrhiza]
MDTAPFLYASLTILFLFLIRKLSTAKTYHLPPTPAAALPVIGHLHLLKQPLHRTLHRLAQATGPIFSLKLGFRRCVVVSSPRLAEECFTKLDTALANRPRILVDDYIGYKQRSMVGAPYGAYWRSLRRIAAQELLSSARLSGFLHIRRDEANRLLLSLLEASRSFRQVELRPKLSELTFNIMMRMIAGKRYSGKDGEEGRRFMKLISEVLAAAQASNPQDFLPFLQWIDYGGYTKKLASLGKELDDFFESLIDEHRRQRKNSMIGHLLSLQESQPEFCSDHIIKGLIMSMLIAGTDTSSVTIEWAMSNLVNNPRILEKVKSELDAKVGKERLMEEEDLSNLPYLNNIILETFRLFPAAPLLLPHEAAEDCQMGGYDVPRGVMVLVNAWAIHRDPHVWGEDAMIFKPERFEGKHFEAHELMPFGMGRRSCPGSTLGQRVVGLALGSLIQCFEWERVGLEEIDLGEGEGLTMPKLEPLQVMCRPREIMDKSDNLFS